jgi:acetylornithine deacetylase
MDQRALAHNLTLKYRDEIVQVMQDLVRLPSRNMPPEGEEVSCQEYLAGYLRNAELPVDMYEPDQVPGMVEHPAFWPGRNYRGRPNISSMLEGKGGGRSLLLTGHMDTVALGDNVWSKPPFGAEIHDGRLYGLGSIDMKGAMGAMLALYKAVSVEKIPLRGALCYESVVDEEEGGVNATIAGRLRHGRMDGAVIPEGTGLAVYPAARGVLVTDFIFSSGTGTWLQVGTGGEAGAGAVEQIGVFLTHLNELQAIRRQHPVHPLYTSYPDPVPVQVTKVYAGGWGSLVPIAVPPEGRIEVIVQTLPGEQRADVLKEQQDWLAGLVAAHPQAFAIPPQTRHRLRWLPGTAIDPTHPLVTTITESVSQVSGRTPTVVGAPYACDMFALHQIFNMPALLFGPTGANAHAADEYVELESIFSFFEALLFFVLQWCGTLEG